MKITVVGAGAVGASCAEYIAIKNFASEHDVNLVDNCQMIEIKSKNIQSESECNYIELSINETTKANLLNDNIRYSLLINNGVFI